MNLMAACAAVGLFATLTALMLSVAAGPVIPIPDAPPKPPTFSLPSDASGNPELPSLPDLPSDLDLPSDSGVPSLPDVPSLPGGDQ